LGPNEQVYIARQLETYTFPPTSSIAMYRKRYLFVMFRMILYKAVPEIAIVVLVEGGEKQPLGGNVCRPHPTWGHTPTYGTIREIS
jgi:hypothetical protein